MPMMGLAETVIAPNAEATTRRSRRAAVRVVFEMVILFSVKTSS
jgi:hypothetical protein